MPKFSKQPHPVFQVDFSRISGEKSTFQVSGDSVVDAEEHSKMYTFFKMPDNFRQYYRK